MDSKEVKVVGINDMVTVKIGNKDYFVNSGNFVSEVQKAAHSAGLSQYKVYVNGNVIGEREAHSMTVKPSDKVMVQPFDEAGS